MTKRIYKPWLFLALALGINWAFGFTAVLLQGTLPGPAVTVLGNAVGELFGVSERGELFILLLTAAAVLVVVSVHGPRGLTKRPGKRQL
jgi:hypothetical protein